MKPRPTRAARDPVAPAKRSPAALDKGRAGGRLKRLGFSRQKARPSHPQKDPAAQAALKKCPGAATKNSVYT